MLRCFGSDISKKCVSRRKGRRLRPPARSRPRRGGRARTAVRARAGTLQRGSALEFAEALAKGLVGLGNDDDGVRVDLGDDILERGDV